MSIFVAIHVYFWCRADANLGCSMHHNVTCVITFYLRGVLPQPLLMKVVAIPVFPERPVLPILCTTMEMDILITSQISHFMYSILTSICIFVHLFAVAYLGVLHGSL